MRWRVGDVTVAPVLEMQFASPLERFIPTATRRDLEAHREWMGPALEGDDRLRMNVQAFCMEADGLRFIIDTCVGNGKRFPEPMGALFNDMDNPFLERLAEAGFKRENVDRVICTHLHMDHVGWNTLQEGGRWVPTFPRARYLFSATDLEYWGGQREHPVNSSFDQAVQPLVDARLVDAVPMEHRVSDSISLIPTPGHSPGHVSVLIRSQGEQALITGDMIHSPIQLAEAAWSSGADTDGAAAAETRRAIQQRIGEAPVLILGTHFPSPTAGHLVREGGRWKFAWAKL